MKVCLSPLSRKGHDGFLGEKGGVILLTYPTVRVAIGKHREWIHNNGIDKF